MLGVVITGAVVNIFLLLSVGVLVVLASPFLIIWRPLVYSFGVGAFAALDSIPDCDEDDSFAYDELFY